MSTIYFNAKSNSRMVVANKLSGPSDKVLSVLLEKLQKMRKIEFFLCIDRKYKICYYIFWVNT